MNHLKIIFLLVYPFCLMQNQSFAQEVIYLNNPSFESERGNRSTLPMYWDDCSDDFVNSPPDLHDRHSSFFNVLARPVDGETFVGMVTRADGTYESVGQFLTNPLEKERTYQFGIYIAQSGKYTSASRLTRREEEFNEPIVLRIWGGNYNGERGELLAETEPINHRDWREYVFEFQPSSDYKFITLEAYYEESAFPYRGNILLDNCSDIMLVDTKSLSEIEDFTNLTEAKLLSLILECKEADANLKDGSLLDIVFDSWHFNNKIKEVGLEKLLSLLSPELLAHYLEVYKVLELNKPSDIIEKTKEVSEKEAQRLRDVLFLKRCDKDYQKAIVNAELRNKHLEFVKENRMEVILLLEVCKNK